MHHPGAGLAAAGAGVLEEGDVCAGRAFLVGVEQVVDGRIVLVDGLLHEPEPEDARVEVDVPGCVGGDRRHVVNAFELHVVSFPPRGHAAVRASSCRSATAETSASTTSPSCSRRSSSIRRPSSSKRVGAWPTATSAVDDAGADRGRATLRSSACAQTAPNAPVEAPTTATGLFRSGFVASGRETQSSAFFSWPGTERVVLGRGEEDGVGAGDRRAQSARRPPRRRRRRRPRRRAGRPSGRPRSRTRRRRRNSSAAAGAASCCSESRAEAAGDGEDLHRRLGRLHEVELGDDRDVVRERRLAGRERVVPVDAEVGAVDAASSSLSPMRSLPVGSVDRRGDGAGHLDGLA